MRRLILALFMLIPLPALAISVPTPPRGMCALDAAKEGQRDVYEFLQQANQGSNKVLLVFADCNEIETGTLAHFGSVMEQQLGKPVDVPRSVYLQSASQIVALNPAFVKKAVAQGTTAASANQLGAGDVSAKSNGVLQNGPDALIIGLEQNHTLQGKKMPVSSVTAMTLISKTPISVNLYAPAGPGAAAQSRDALALYVADLIKANE